MLLEKLCNLDGVSGNEGAVRDFIKSQISSYADNISVDNIGNLIAFKKGSDSSKKVMLSCHTDEVGFIINGITKEGYLEFQTVGGIDTRVIISKKVRIGNIKGIIGIKAIHLTTKSERENIPKVKDLYIDIGAKDEEDAKKYVKLGDYAAFDTDFELLGKSSIKAKAIDDRVGCYILTELIKQPVQYDTYFCFCTQEEVGLRGSRVAAYKINPDICLVIEATTCSDVKGSVPHGYSTIMNKGAAISFMDRTTIYNKDLYEWLYELAKKKNIPVQYKNLVAGGNDAGIIHLTNNGIPTLSVSLPCRYIHSPCGIASLDDIESLKKLSLCFIKNIGEII